ncbi:geranylgeranyl transferase type-1 subunit beta-like [Styela clava]
MAESNNLKFDKDKHIRFFTRTLQVLPSRYEVLDSNRLTIAFFAVSGLDVLNSLNKLSSSTKKEIIDWIYSLQVVPDKHGSNKRKCGFRGSTTNGVTTHKDIKVAEVAHTFDSGHIAMTYTGLACLIILGDDLSRVDKTACLEGLKALQLKDGSFESTLDGSENDMRFIYCASCICTMLDDFSPINESLAVSYIKKSKSYDGGFGQGPGQESHGGSTYCAISSLLLLNQLHNAFSQKEIMRLQRWCLNRQKSGFHGRPHKDDDTCYSFWIGASLKLIGSLELCDWHENEQYIISTQDSVIGGFGKWPQSHPDALHGYMGLCGLSMMGMHNLSPINPALNITQRASDHMFSLHRTWHEEKLKNQSPTLTDAMGTHFGTTVMAFVIGLGAVFLPWIYSNFSGSE